MARREAIEDALAAWRTAERRLAEASSGEADYLRDEVERHRDEFQVQSADEMIESIGKLHEAERRRANATPSTLPFHLAARDTQEIASDIWEAARSSDEDTPTTEIDKGTAPRPIPPATS